MFRCVALKAFLLPEKRYNSMRKHLVQLANIDKVNYNYENLIFLIWFNHFVELFMWELYFLFRHPRYTIHWGVKWQLRISLINSFEFLKIAYIKEKLFPLLPNFLFVCDQTADLLSHYVSDNVSKT